ncbi:hypothetical protein [Cupriavidus basilensis]|uniref:hypothetical protein n=1 Tax=Cupriavidus basilensis TaxID=68895 RepID=UPI00157A2BA7|nr:hypothetical protein [Cupriavidus basilensis]NUA30632.1 hypothetical protein [Cupriavidus basilensis]
MSISLLGFLVFEALWFFPFRKVFRTARFKSGYEYLALIPIFGPLACVWILAFRPWPLKSRLVRTLAP